MTANSVSHQIDLAFSLLREGRCNELGRRLINRLHQTWISYGLRRDLSIPFPVPKARIPISVRELQTDDLPHFFPPDLSAVPRKERLDLAARRAHIDATIPTCYVAIDQRTNTPCFLQWLMGPAHNDRIQRFFQGRFPPLREDEALLENAYTPLAYRGKGIMPTAMAMIAERATELGCRYVHTFVSRENVPSLKGCAKAGFLPYQRRFDSRSFFHLYKRRRFELLPDGFIFEHEKKGAEER